MKKAGKIGSSILLAFLIVAVLVLVAPRLLGVRLYSVLSGSMEPAYSVGDLIYVAPTDPAELKVGDPISFLMNSQGTVATHRIIEIDAENRQLYTKGDANQVGDGKPVRFENVIGKVVFALPMLGYIIGYINTTPGRIIAVTVILSLIVLVVLLQKVGEDEAPPLRRAHGGKQPRRAAEEKRRQKLARAREAQERQRRAEQAALRRQEQELEAAEQAEQAALRRQEQGSAAAQEFCPPASAAGYIGRELLEYHKGGWYYTRQKRYRARYPDALQRLQTVEKGGRLLWREETDTITPPAVTAQGAAQAGRPLGVDEILAGCSAAKT